VAIRAVIFDIGGVLQDVRPMDFTQQWERRLGVGDGEIGQRTVDLWLAGNVGLIDEPRLREGLSQRLSITESMVDDLLDDMWRQYLGTANQGMVDCLGRLRPRFRTGLLSNSFIGAREREELAYGYSGLVDDIVYSHEVGIEKPNPRIYEIACQRLGVDPSEVVFVDDTQMAVDGAEAVGMVGILHRENATTIAQLAEVLGSAL
jgi:epoxide hydrolase-like predicted phosphatase